MTKVAVSKAQFNQDPDGLGPLLMAQVSKLDSSLTIFEIDEGYLWLDFAGRAAGGTLAKAVEEANLRGYQFDGYSEQGYACWVAC